MNELYHHGILGQRWGVRRFQNKDGTLTEAGRNRTQYGNGADRETRKANSAAIDIGLAALPLAVGNINPASTLSAVTSIGRIKTGGGKGRQERLSKKLEDKTLSSEKRQKLETKLEAQRKLNEARAIYDNYTSNGKMYVQDFLMGGFANGEMYRNARARGAGRVRSIFEAGTLSPVGAVLRGTANKKRYGDWFVAGDTDSAELYHHGILGQKWGVRRFQDKSGKLTALGKQMKAFGDSAKKSISELGSKKQKNEYDHSESKISKQKVSEIINKASNLRHLGPGEALVSAGVDFIKGKIPDLKVATELNRTSNLSVDPKNNLPLKDKTWTNEDDIKAVNPGFKNFDENTKNNCVLCTTAYDLRQRGYDVQANKASYGYNLYDAINHWYVGAQCNMISGTGQGVAMSSGEDTLSEEDYLWQLQNPDAYADLIMEELKKNGGKRGNLGIQWRPPGCGGHSIVYENNGGKLRIIDCQTATVYDKPGQIKGLLRNTYGAMYANLDKAEPNPETIHEAINEGK